MKLSEHQIQDSWLNDGLEKSSNICKAKICASLEGLNMTAGCGFSLTVVSVVSILTLSESLDHLCTNCFVYSTKDRDGGEITSE